MLQVEDTDGGFLDSFKVRHISQLVRRRWDASVVRVDRVLFVQTGLIPIIIFLSSLCLSLPVGLVPFLSKQPGGVTGLTSHVVSDATKSHHLFHLSSLTYYLTHNNGTSLTPPPPPHPHPRPTPLLLLLVTR